MDIFSLFAVIFCFFLYSRVKKLEKIIEERLPSSSRKETVLETEESEPRVQETITTEPDDAENVLIKEEEKTEEKEGGLEKFIHWLAVDWLMKLGGFLLILAAAWFVTYAFMNDWIGPLGRITLGIVFGALVMAYGELRAKKVVDQGGVLLVLGATIILLTIFAARELYNYFTPLSSLVIMFLVVVYVAGASLRFKNRGLAILSLIMGAIVPMLTNTSEPSMSGLFSYLLLLSAGTLWIVGITGWRILTPLSFLVVFVYNAPYLLSGYLPEKEKFSALIFAFLFTLIFYVANLALVIVRKKVENSDLGVAIANGIFLLFWINQSLAAELRGTFAMLSALVFCLGAYVVYRTLNLKQPMYIYSGVAVGLLAAATAFELDGAVLTIAFTVEALSLSMLSLYLSKDVQVAQKISALITMPVIMSLGSLTSRAWRRGVIHEDFFVLLLLILAFLLMGVVFYKFDKNNNHKEVRSFTQLSFVMTCFYSIAIIWLSLEAALRDYDTAHMLALIIYTICGLSFYIRGVVKEWHGLKITGSIILGLVVGRLLFVEAWNMDLSGRIITFFVVAILLIATALISKKKK